MSDARVTLRWTEAELTCTDKLHLCACNIAALKDAANTLARTQLRGQEYVGDADAFAVIPDDPALQEVVPAANFNANPERWAQAQTAEVGRWYPAKLLAERAHDAAAFRVLETTQSNLKIYSNHPLAGANAQALFEAVETTAAIAGRSEPEVLLKLSNWLKCGPGMQRNLAPRPACFDSDRSRRRNDESPDSIFYLMPRFVQHIDAHARATIAQLYDAVSIKHAHALDLMSSWVTHLPQIRTDIKLTGLGMNEQELRGNTGLERWDLQDLNQTPQLPYEDASFDVVFCSVSVEYLTRAREVFAAVARVLRPGGVFINTFSDRCFPSKAIMLWAELNPFERMRFIADIYQRDGNYTDINCWSLQGAPRPPDDDYADRMPDADPVFAVWATRV